MSFNLLDKKLQEKIITKLQWKSLTPVQEASIPPILQGKNSIILAPTAGGKTEACFFPILSLMNVNRVKGLRCIYISPIKALLNNQETRLKELGGFLEFNIFKWHGDVARNHKEAFLNEPSEILMTTPESLEVILSNPKIDKYSIFRDLDYIVIDEIHAFASNNRGAQLVSLIERLDKFTNRDIQRIGLSATVGNPEEILLWLKGGSKRNGIVVKPRDGKKRRKIEIKYEESIPLKISEFYKRVYGRKALIFSNGRGGCEKISSLLKEKGIDAYVHHSSINKERREKAEELFKHGVNKTIVATSTLELGIDIGGLDLVIQDAAPRTVSSFLQRMGRTGRRKDTIPWYVFIPGKIEELLLSISILTLAIDGWVESIEINRKNYGIYAHQIIMMVFSNFGIAVEEVYNTLKNVVPFSNISEVDFNTIITHFIEEEILIEERGRLFIGKVIEKDFGSKNFVEIYSTFITEEEFSVKDSDGVVGTLEFNFAFPLEAGNQFVLAGERWIITKKDNEKRVIYVDKAKIFKDTLWSRNVGFLSFEVSRRILSILTERKSYNFLGITESSIISKLQDEFIFEGYSMSSINIQNVNGKIKIHTYAGNRVNNSLFKVITLFDKNAKLESSDWDILSLKLSQDTVKENLVIFLREFYNEYQENIKNYHSDFLSSISTELESNKFQKYLPNEFIQEEIYQELYDFHNLEYILSLI